MPIYEYRDMKTGLIEERFATVERRDCVPPHLQRITVPRSVGYANASHLREPGAAVDVPKAFRDYELSGKSPKQIEKESGFSREAIRRIWKFCFVGLFGISLSASAADIGAGYIFSAGEQNITHSKLNAVVGGAAINTAFYSDKTTAVPAGGDTFLFLSSSAGDFRKTDYSTLFLRNTTLITGAIEDTSPDPIDFLLTYNVASGLFNKTTITNLLNALNTSNLLANSSDLDVSNIYERGFSLAGAFTNLLFYTAPINTDALLIWASASLTNKQITLASLATNVPTATTATNGDFLTGYSTNDNTVAKFTVKQIQSYVTNAANSPTMTNGLPAKFVSSEFSITTGLPVDTAHSLGAVPTQVQFVLVCKTAELGYSIGDEVDVLPMDQSSDPNFNAGKNATNIFCVVRQTGTIRVLNKTTGVLTTTLNTANWRLKGYATLVR